MITGATSMIGVATINALLKREGECKIYAVIRSNSNHIDRIPHDDRVKHLFCDMKDYIDLTNRIDEKCDSFIHLAWLRTDTYSESYEDMLIKCQNMMGVLSAVEVAKHLGCSRFVYAGGQSEYGIHCKSPLTPETECNPVRVDGVAKFAAGKMGKILAEKYGLVFVWMRIFSAYGEYDRDNSLIMSTIRKMQKGERLLFTPCEQKWEFLNARDIGEAFCLAAQKATKSKVYCVGSGDAKPLKEFIYAIRDVVNPDANLEIGALPYPKDAVMYLCADNSSLKDDLGWEPRISFKDGIEKILISQNNYYIEK